MSSVLVVKIGGSTLDSLTEDWWDDLAALGGSAPLVCVHGWSRQLSRYQEGKGCKPTFLVNQNGHRSRFTDREVLADIRHVARGVRSGIEEQLSSRGLRVRTCEGDADGLLAAESRSSLWWRDGRLVPLVNLVGRVKEPSRDRLEDRLEGHDALVVTPLAREPKHGTVNTDGDRAAACIAAGMGVKSLLLVTDVSHVHLDGGPVSEMQATDLDGAARRLRGGMRKKVLAASEALAGGVERVHIGSAKPSALLADGGTVIER